MQKLINPKIKEFYTVLEEAKEDINEQLEILKNSFQNDKDELIKEYNTLKTHLKSEENYHNNLMLLALLISGCAKKVEIQKEYIYIK